MRPKKNDFKILKLWYSKVAIYHMVLHRKHFWKRHTVFCVSFASNKFTCGCVSLNSFAMGTILYKFLQQMRFECMKETERNQFNLSTLQQSTSWFDIIPMLLMWQAVWCDFNSNITIQFAIVLVWKKHNCIAELALNLNNTSAIWTEPVNLFETFKLRSVSVCVSLLFHQNN